MRIFITAKKTLWITCVFLIAGIPTAIYEAKRHPKIETKIQKEFIYVPQILHDVQEKIVTKYEKGYPPCHDAYFRKDSNYDLIECHDNQSIEVVASKPESVGYIICRCIKP